MDKDQNLTQAEQPLLFDFYVQAMTTHAASRVYFLLTSTGWHRHKERGT